MAARTRQKSTEGGTGSYTINVPGSTPTYRTARKDADWCDDVTGNFKGQNPFTVKHARTNIVQLNGIAGSYSHAQLPVTCCDALRYGTTTFPGWNPTYSDSIASAIASSHPGEPHLSLPNFLFELKDVPGMLKHALGKLRPPRNRRNRPISELANDHLQYAFGWAPLLSDLSKIWDVSEWTDQRARMLLRAQQQGFITRTKQRGTHSQRFVVNNEPYNTFGYSISGVATTDCSSRAWTSSRWRYVGSIPFGSSLSQARQGLKSAAYGWDLTFDTIWNAIPWSWMVDYFTDISDILSIHSNKAGFKFDSAVAMEHRMITTEVEPKRGLELGASKVTILRESKARTIATPTIFDAQINFLRPKQLANLVALGVTRLGR